MNQIDDFSDIFTFKNGEKRRNFSNFVTFPDATSSDTEDASEKSLTANITLTFRWVGN